MEAARVRDVFEAVLPKSVVSEAVIRLGVQHRKRDFDPCAMVFSLVLLGGTAEAGRLGAAVRDYFEAGHKKVARSAYYRWFDQEFLTLMGELAERALAYARSMETHLPGVLAGRKDWYVMDSTTVTLDKLLKETYPGAGDYAALKVHTLISLGTENLVRYEITPAREHDAPKLVIDEFFRGCGLLVDLGYVSHALLQAAADFDVHLVIRLKDGWKSFVDTSVTASEVCTWTFGDDMEACFNGAQLPKELNSPLDVDVRLGNPNSPTRARLVNVETPEGFRAFLTTLPRETHDAEAVGFLYRLRWSVEIHNKLAKSGCQLDHIEAKRPVSAEIVVHAAMIASVLASALAHLEHLSMGLVGAKAKVPPRPPHHAMLLWKCVVSASERIADLLSNPDGGQRLGWDHVAGFLTHGGQDPNWRRKPSPIDDAKGRNGTGKLYWASRAADDRSGSGRAPK